MVRQNNNPSTSLHSTHLIIYRGGRDGNRWLLVKPGTVDWVVSDTLEGRGGWLWSGKGTRCPTLGSGSQRFGREGWAYSDGGQAHDAKDSVWVTR